MQFIHGNLTPKKLFFSGRIPRSLLFWSVNFERPGVSVKSSTTKIITINEIVINNLISKQLTSAHPFHALNAKRLGWPEKDKPKHYMKSPTALNKNFGTEHILANTRPRASAVLTRRWDSSLCKKCSQITGFIYTVA